MNHISFSTDSKLSIVMSVLRMIKLFGWETRVRDTIAEKREEELNWVWKRKLLGVINDCAKYVNTTLSHCMSLS